MGLYAQAGLQPWLKEIATIKGNYLAGGASASEHSALGLAQAAHTQLYCTAVGLVDTGKLSMRPNYVITWLYDANGIHFYVGVEDQSPYKHERPVPNLLVVRWICVLPIHSFIHSFSLS